MYFPLTPLCTINTDVFHSSVLLLPPFAGGVLRKIVRVVVGRFPSVIVKEGPTRSSIESQRFKIAVQRGVQLNITVIEDGRQKRRWNYPGFTVDHG